MKKKKHYPKQAIASLVLLAVSLMLIWTNWINLNQNTSIAKDIPALQDGGISFFDGWSFTGIVSELNNSVYRAVPSHANPVEPSTLNMINLLNIVHQLMFFVTILSVIYCAYSRLAWKSGYSEGIYFLIFIGDFGIMYLMMNELNSIFAESVFGIGFGGIAALICALISEILWEEASFNTPKLPDTTTEELT